MGSSRSVWAKQKPGSLQEYHAWREDPFSAPNTNTPPAPPLPSATATHPPAQSNPHWQRAAPRLSSPLLLFDSLSRPHTYRPSGFSLYTHTNVCIYIWLLLSYFITFHHYWTLGERVCTLRSAQNSFFQLLFSMFYNTDVWAAAIWSPKWNKVWMGDFAAQG